MSDKIDIEAIRERRKAVPLMEWRDTDLRNGVIEIREVGDVWSIATISNWGSVSFDKQRAIAEYFTRSAPDIDALLAEMERLEDANGRLSLIVVETSIKRNSLQQRVEALEGEKAKLREAIEREISGRFIEDQAGPFDQEWEARRKCEGTWKVMVRGGEYVVATTVCDHDGDRANRIAEEHNFALRLHEASPRP